MALPKCQLRRSCTQRCGCRKVKKKAILSLSHFQFARLFLCFITLSLSSISFADTWDSVWPTLPIREFSAEIIIFLAILILLNSVLNLVRFLISFSTEANLTFFIWLDTALGLTRWARCRKSTLDLVF